MKSLITPGRFLFAIAIAAFGIQHLIFAITGAGLGPPWAPVNHVLAFLVGVILIAGGVGVATSIQLRCAGILLAVLFIVRPLLCYVPKLAANIRDPGPWTSAFELLAMGGASLVLAAAFQVGRSRSGRSGGPASAWFAIGRILFGVSLVVFGIQHLMYGKFVATLIPAWIPGRLFFAYFVGVAFIAAALAIVSGILAPLAATLLGTMFFLWVVMLHAPRVAAALHNANEWTSLLVALAMSGGAFIVAGAVADRN
jgi:uncharacterized membrane protein YphA (DoxX/SURF4 family)